MSEITKYRGDTKPIKFILYENQAAGIRLDITSYSFKLTVDPSKAPVNSDNNLFTLTGVITDASNGEVQFEPTSVQMDQTPATYYFDFEITDANGKTETAVLDKFKIVQDITK